MDFQKLLLGVERALRPDEVKALAFLCSNLLGRSLTSVKSASELFSHLTAQDLLSAEQPHLLRELLLIIQRTRLVRELGLTAETCTTGNHISPYRKLLYGLSEDLTDENLKDMKFLLNGQLPRKKLEENVTTLEVFQELEQMDLINENNLKLLEKLLQSCCPVLVENIKKFKEQQVPHSGPVAQETGRPRSMSYPLEQNQPEGGFLDGIPASGLLGQSAMSSSNTSVGRFDVPDARDEGQSLSLAMSGLSTTSNSSPSLEVRTNELTLVQPQTNMNYDKQTPQTTDAEVLESYPMTGEKRGLCLIINNYDFSKSKKFLKDREGTKVDEDSLIKVFKWLGFEIELQKDCKREEILSLVQKLGQRDHSDTHCLVCCILSHGEEECVLGVDGLPVYLKDLKEPFNGLKCLSLVDKPKLFFIQACQGTGHQSPVYIEADGPVCGHISSDARRDSIPTDADFLLAMATVPLHVSYREKSSGTWFIQSLCQNLVQMVPRRFDLVSILTKVNADVSKKTDGTGVKKQMPQPAFTLRKKVVFPLPPDPPPSL